MEKKTKYNPTVGSGFTNNKFGSGSIKIDLTAEGIQTFIQNAQVGGSLLIRFNKTTPQGNNHYFAEILEPFHKTAKYTEVKARKESGTVKKTGATTNTSELD